MRLLRAISYPIFVVNLLLLLVAALAPYISPRIFWPPAFIGLFFKLFLFFHILFLFYFIWKRKRKAAIAAVAGLALCLPALGKTFALHPTAMFHEPEGYRIMTYNVQNFGWYDDSVKLSRILTNMNDNQPDIICMQEYYMDRKKHHELVNYFCAEKGYPYYWEYAPESKSLPARFGLAIFSRRPFYNFQGISFAHTVNGAFYVDVPMEEDTLRVINVHFQSIGLKEKEYTLPSQEDNAKAEERLDRMKLSMGKFMKAFRKRSYQAEQVKDVVRRSPHPVIVCGDFNDSPVSYLYSQLTQDLEDTYLETNFGLGTSFAGKIPFQRIDYILASPGIDVNRTRVLHVDGSDHYPLICHFRMAKQATK